MPLPGRPALLALGVLTAALATPAVAGAYAPLPFEQAAVDEFTQSLAIATGTERQVAVLASVQDDRPATLVAVQRPSGGPPGPVQGLDAEPGVGFLNLSSLDAGGWLAAWSHATNGATGSFARAEAGRLFSPAASFPSPEGRHSMGVDREGRAVAVWNGVTTGANRVVRSGTLPPSGTVVNAAGDLTTPQVTTLTPRVSVSPGGQAAAAWSRPDGGGAVVEASIGTTIALGSPRPPIASFADDADVADVTVAIGPFDVVVVAWTDLSGPVPAVRATFRDTGGAFGPPVTLSGGGTAGSPSVVVGAAGVATIAWVEGGAVRAASRAQGSPPGAAVTVSQTGVVVGPNRSPEVVTDPAGAVHVTWMRAHLGSALLESARRAPGGAFSAPALLGTDVAAFDTATEPGGNLAAVWLTPTFLQDFALRIGGLDGDRPAVDATVPPTAGAGVPQTFSATATDWGGIASYSWDLGDGTTASGATVGHVYGAPGPRVVTLRVTDRAGNVTTVTRTVTVIGTSISDLDRRPPRATQVRVAKTIARSTLVRRGIGVRLRADEASRATVELLGRARAATLNARGDVVLAQRAARLTAGRARAFVLKPPARLVSGGRGAFRATVRITLTDTAGNRATITRAVRVRTA